MAGGSTTEDAFRQSEPPPGSAGSQCSEALSLLLDRQILPDYNWLILARNSLFVSVFAKRSISSSMASTGESGFNTLRKTQIRARSSLGISSSSFRVPDR